MKTDHDPLGTDVAKVIACNVAVASASLPIGGLAFVTQVSMGRVRVLARSRGGRWVTAWIETERLGNFRIKSVDPEHRTPGEIQAAISLCSRESWRIDQLASDGAGQNLNLRRGQSP